MIMSCSHDYCRWYFLIFKIDIGQLVKPNKLDFTSYNNILVILKNLRDSIYKGLLTRQQKYFQLKNIH